MESEIREIKTEVFDEREFWRLVTEDADVPGDVPQVISFNAKQSIGVDHGT